MNWVLLSNLSNFLYLFPAARFAESANFSIERIISNACNPNSLGSCVGYKLLSLLNQYSSRSQMMIDKKTWRRFIIMMASYCVALKQLSKRSSSHWPSHAANQILAALSRWWCWDRAYKAWGHIFRPESCAAKCCWCYNVQTICSSLFFAAFGFIGISCAIWICELVIGNTTLPSYYLKIKKLPKERPLPHGSFASIQLKNGIFKKFQREACVFHF